MSERMVTIPLAEYNELLAASKDKESIRVIDFRSWGGRENYYISKAEAVAEYQTALNALKIRVDELTAQLDIRRDLKRDLAKMSIFRFLKWRKNARLEVEYES